MPDEHGEPGEPGEPGAVGPGGTTVTVRYFAGAAAAAGTAEERVELPGGATVAVLVEHLARAHGPALARVLPAASFLVDAVAGPADRLLADGGTVDVLPPFAGG